MLRYAITDRTRFPGDEAARQNALLRQVRLWCDRSQSAFVPDLVQLRERDLDGGALAQLARELLGVFRASSDTPKLLINSRADVAIAVRADGVHLTSASGSLTPAQIRKLYAAAKLPAPVISLSCHTVAEVARAAASPEAERPTLILFGPVFEKVVAGGEHIDTPVSAGTGLDSLRRACLAAGNLLPVLALGGISRENTQACVDAGAGGIAAIRLFLH